MVSSGPTLFEVAGKTFVWQDREHILIYGRAENAVRASILAFRQTESDKPLYGATLIAIEAPSQSEVTLLRMVFVDDHRVTPGFQELNDYFRRINTALTS